MTDITDPQEEFLTAFARGVASRPGSYSEDLVDSARALLATVDAPAPTLADGIRGLPDYTMSGDHCLNDCYDQAKDLANRAEQIEQERDQARSEAKAWEERFRAAKDDSSELAYDLDDMEQRALKAEAEVERLKDAWEELDKQRIDEVERLTAERVTDPSPTLNDGSMMRPATVAREENVSPDLPDPADVKPGETWIVNIDGVEIVPGFKASVGWICYRLFDGTTKAIGDERITLVSRLVPAPRTITTREELNALPEGTVIRARGELVCERYRHRSKGLVWISAGVDEDFPVERPVLPATVLWTPEVPA